MRMEHALIKFMFPTKMYHFSSRSNQVSKFPRILPQIWSLTLLHLFFNHLRLAIFARIVTLAPVGTGNGLSMFHSTDDRFRTIVHASEWHSSNWFLYEAKKEFLRSTSLLQDFFLFAAKFSRAPPLPGWLTIFLPATYFRAVSQRRLMRCRSMWS